MTQLSLLRAWRKTLVRAGAQLLAVLALAGASAAPALADPDPPTRAGRVAAVQGSAWLLDPESQEWTQLVRNQTIAQGDQLRTDPGARVALRIGSTSLWLGADSDLEISQLDDDGAVLRLDQGDLGLRLRAAQTAGAFRVLTPEGDISPDGESLLRINLGNGGTQLAVLQGRARFEAQRNGSVQRDWLREGEQSAFWWDGGFRSEQQALGRDAFGDWVLAQDRAQNSQSARIDNPVSPEMTGAEELDQYGRWEDSADYGRVWTPTHVAIGWTPYRDGHWVWTRLWGWSWVDDAPWGFAPFHYGRWVHWRGRWGWAPGRYVLRPVYAPALVAWVGGPQVSVSITIGGRPQPRFGWYPLAPREVYVPGFAHSTGYLHRLNGGPGPARPPRAHANLHVRGAVSYLPGQGAPVRAMVVSASTPVRTLSAPPGRQDLAHDQPPRRTDTAGPRRGSDTRGNPQRDAASRDGRPSSPDRGDRMDRGDRASRNTPTAPPAAPTVQAPQMPSPNNPRAGAPQGTQTDNTPPSPRPARGERGQGRDRERTPVLPQAQVPSPAPVAQTRPEPAAQSPQPSAPQPWMRSNDRQRAQESDRGERAQRSEREPARERSVERERPREASPQTSTAPVARNAPTREAARPMRRDGEEWPPNGRRHESRERDNDRKG